MGLFSRESDEARALKEEWLNASEDAQNADTGTAAGARAMRIQTEAAQAYRDQVARDKNK
jgi:hypothetical protein